jgi:hypothetical protein
MFKNNNNNLDKIKLTTVVGYSKVNTSKFQGAYPRTFDTACISFRVGLFVVRPVGDLDFTSVFNLWA